MELYISHQRPFMGYTQIHQVDKIKYIDQGEQDVVFDPVPAYLSPYHNADIGDDGGGKKK